MLLCSLQVFANKIPRLKPDFNVLDPSRISFDSGRAFIPMYKEKVRVLNFRDASYACAADNAHLATARELADFASRLGAEEILDNCSNISECQDLTTIESDGKRDTFSFSGVGHEAFAFDSLGEGVYYYISSSKTEEGFEIALHRDGFFVKHTPGETWGAALCIKK